MFGGQDNGIAPQTDAFGAPQDDALKGVTALAGDATAVPVTVGTQNAASLPAAPTDYTDTPQASAPALPDALTPQDGTASAPAPATADNDGGNLLDLKQQALQQLTPMISHLEQTPLEKFRTTMMLIQASDNQALLKDAYAAAQAIPDEKIRAQALLDVVNEINYFTQPKGQ